MYSLETPARRKRKRRRRGKHERWRRGERKWGARGGREEEEGKLGARGPPLRTEKLCALLGSG